MLIGHELAHERQQFAHQQAPAAEPAHDDDEDPARRLPHLPHPVREYPPAVVARQLVQDLLRKYDVIRDFSILVKYNGHDVTLVENI